MSREVSYVGEVKIHKVLGKSATDEQINESTPSYKITVPEGQTQARFSIPNVAEVTIPEGSHAVVQLTADERTRLDYDEKHHKIKVDPYNGDE